MTEDEEIFFTVWHGQNEFGQEEPDGVSLVTFMNVDKVSAKNAETMKTVMMALNEENRPLELEKKSEGCYSVSLRTSFAWSLTARLRKKGIREIGAFLPNRPHVDLICAQTEIKMLRQRLMNA